MGTTVDRATLYAKVWAAPMGQIGEEYGVSGASVKNACDFLNDPAPPKGYWRQKQFGREPITLQLPSDSVHRIFTFQGEPAAGPYHRAEDNAWLEERTRLEPAPARGQWGYRVDSLMFCPRQGRYRYVGSYSHEPL